METNEKILNAAYRAWSACSSLRQRRNRNKTFVYGDQWSDLNRDIDGTIETEGQRSIRNGVQPLTNNVLRQLVRTVVGRYRTEVINAEKEKNRDTAKIKNSLQVNELDSRAMEEFLISGSAIQKVYIEKNLGDKFVMVDNVNISHFFIDSATDSRGNDCHLIGQLHDLTFPEVLKLVNDGSRKNAQHLRKIYTEDLENRIADFSTKIGADSLTGTSFWSSGNGKCRVIEVWTKDSKEVLVCTNKHNAKLYVVPMSDFKEVKNMKANADLECKWDVAFRWVCRFYSPAGDLLKKYDAPDIIGSHPYVTKFFPLIDGEVHSFVEGAIDQQKQINRLITMVNKVMESSAKGVLLFPETALPDGFTWTDVRKAWSNAGGILPYDPRESDARPQQIVSNGTNIGAYDMINLQMKMIEQVSGVSGALQGRTGLGGNSASLYEMQSRNSVIALADLFETFNSFRELRNILFSKNITLLNSNF